MIPNSMLIPISILTIITPNCDNVQLQLGRAGLEVGFDGAAGAAGGVDFAAVADNQQVNIGVGAVVAAGAGAEKDYGVGSDGGLRRLRRRQSDGVRGFVLRRRLAPGRGAV